MASIIRPLFVGVTRQLVSRRLTTMQPQTISRCFCVLQSSRWQQEQPAKDDKRLQEFFRAYDLNGDGEITREELFRALKRAIGYNDMATESIVEAVYHDCGKKGDEKITFPEFKAGIKVMV